MSNFANLPKLGAVLLGCLLVMFAAAGRAQTVDATSVVGPASAPATGWQVVGRQGIIRVVIVPVDRMHDKDAYMEQINQLCEPGQTCFLNFFTNTTNAALELPLPDAISHEATALFRRSIKQGAEMFEWSCRMQSTDNLCF